MLFGLGSSWVEADLLVVGLVIVEDYFEQPRCLAQIRLHETGYAIAVFDALDVAIGDAHPIALARLAAVYVFFALSCVFISDSIAFIIIAFTYVPREDARRVGRKRILRIEDAAIVVLAVQRRHIDRKSTR